MWKGICTECQYIGHHEYSLYTHTIRMPYHFQADFLEATLDSVIADCDLTPSSSSFITSYSNETSEPLTYTLNWQGTEATDIEFGFTNEYLAG